MKMNALVGLSAGTLLWICISVLAQIGVHNETSGLLGFFQNSAFIFNFTSLLIPATISSVLFPQGGVAEVIMINGISLIQFLLIGFVIGKTFEANKQIRKK